MESLGFVVADKVELVASDEIEKNRVVRTNPAAKKKAKAGTTVTIYKSSGEESFTLEDYTGKNYIEVKTILTTKYGLKVTVEKKDVNTSDKEYNEQEIIGQSLAAGSQVKEGDQLILFIPNLVDEFPNMLEEGWSLEDAEAFCTKYGLTISVVYEETEAYAEGKVISQSRAAGSPIVKGQTLKVTIAKKPTVKPKPTTPEPETKPDTGTGTGSESSSGTGNNSGTSSGTGE